MEMPKNHHQKLVFMGAFVRDFIETFIQIFRHYLGSLRVMDMPKNYSQKLTTMRTFLEIFRHFLSSQRAKKMPQNHPQ
jgi:hypothetical protein